MKRLVRAWLALGGAALATADPPVLPPANDYGALAEAVARGRVFADDKAFVDAIPLGPPAAIRREYEEASARGPVDLPAFIAAHFRLPPAPPPVASSAPGLPLAEHVRRLWKLLARQPGPAPPGSSLLLLPEPYVVPGGRFQEMYYWDSYFTMLGLRADGETRLVRSMTNDFAALVSRFGFIPNGNRTYYLTRSQPPFFALMVLLAPPSERDRYAPALRGEYAYWMDRTFPTHHRVVDGPAAGLNRYWDRGDSPRPEERAADERVAAEALARGAQAGRVYRDLRSAAESGWDFSSRWLDDSRSLARIATTQVVPVDLNCLLWQLEEAAGEHAAAGLRARAIRDRFWDGHRGFFADLEAATGRSTGRLSLAGLFPLFFGLATPDQARMAAGRVRRDFLQPGGLVTTLAPTGQQWDWPNGWAPLQWIAIEGLRRYGEDELAAEVAHRWLALNERVYRRTGRMMEKYNVVDLEAPGGGGEYPGQDGFGWTNGVSAALRQRDR